jgi:hypothetical protein
LIVDGVWIVDNNDDLDGTTIVAVVPQDSHDLAVRIAKHFAESEGVDIIEDIAEEYEGVSVWFAEFDTWETYIKEMESE